MPHSVASLRITPFDRIGRPPSEICARPIGDERTRWQGGRRWRSL